MINYYNYHNKRAVFIGPKNFQGLNFGQTGTAIKDALTGFGSSHFVPDGAENRNPQAVVVSDCDIWFDEDGYYNGYNADFRQPETKD